MTASYQIKIHFLNRQKVSKRVKRTKNLRWFSGKMSGHVGLEFAPGQVLDFVPYGSFHLVARKHKLHSKFRILTLDEFRKLFGEKRKPNKGPTIVIPVTSIQQKQMECTAYSYHQTPPFDYAFWGMRCASAIYHLLAKCGIVKNYSISKTAIKIFTPEILKNHLLKMARQKDWLVIT